MPALFAVTLFVSATLLFLVQPMVAKMVLPKFGGTPAVWNTCMVLFQALLLAGYAYAHAATARLGARRQAGWHCLLLLVPLAALPIAVPRDPPGDGSPVLWLLWLLLLAAGLPFFVASASAPLLQRWFAGTGHPAARDPYFLYAASNLGSMLALLGYPVLVEPSLRLRQQSWLWAAGYGLLALLTAACAFALREANPVDSARAEKALEGVGTGLEADAPTGWRRLHWVALAFVPSSLMLGVTTYMSTDIAAIPLIWVVPLALYLLSFILVFSRLPEVLHQFFILALPVLILLQLFLMLTESNQKMWVLISLHLTTLFVVAMVCHGELARTRPAARHLTEFYLWMSVGGVLGGMFNALLAPVAFTNIIEYPLALVAACLLMPSLGGGEGRRWSRWLDVALPVGLALGTFAFIYYTESSVGTKHLNWLHGKLESLAEGTSWKESVPGGYRLRRALQFGIPALLCYLFVARPVRFGLGVGAILLAGGVYTWMSESQVFLPPELRWSDHVLYRDRSFFGVLRVESGEDNPGVRFNRLLHGTTLHGKQRTNEDGTPERGCEPLTYYHTTGPIGQLFTTRADEKKIDPVALVGLGTGTLAYYAAPTQEVDYYEIDRAVVKIARNPAFFTYLQEADERGARLDIKMGDARLKLKEAAPHRYGVIVVDAFSSDAIPIHLITYEALELYLDKLREDGVIAFHISNRYLDLEPVVANLAAKANLVGIVRHDDSEDEVGKTASTWILLARHESAFGALREDFKEDAEDKAHHWYRFSDQSRWDPKYARPDVGVWTDDYSNILSVFLWGN